MQPRLPLLLTVPKAYQEMINSVKSKHWQEAVQDEGNSLKGKWGNNSFCKKVEWLSVVVGFSLLNSKK